MRSRKARATCCGVCRSGAVGRVALVLPNSPECSVAIYAALAGRAQVALFNPAYTKDELAPLLVDADPAVVVTSPSASHVSAALAAGQLTTTPVLTLDTASVDRWASDPALDTSHIPLPRPDDPATLMYTGGGTTGIPKGVDHTHATVLSTVQAMEASWPTELDTEVWATVAPMSHIWGLLMGVLNPVYGRATVISFPRFQPDAVIAAMERHRVTVFSGGPAAIYGRLLEASNLTTADLRRHLKVCPGGGSFFPAEVLRRWEQETGVEIREAFGMTEVAPVSCQVPGRRAVAGSVGRPAPGVEIRIAAVDGSREPQPAGTIGEVLVRSPRRMFRGYRGRPKETADVLDDGWLRTGDLGRFDEKGQLHIAGRKKEMMLVDGFNVYPREIDELLASHPDVQESVTVGVPHPRHGEQPVSFIVPTAGKSPDIKDLFQYCSRRLVKYKQPADIMVLEEIPRTPARKEDRQALRALLADPNEA